MSSLSTTVIIVVVVAFNWKVELSERIIFVQVTDIAVTS